MGEGAEANSNADVWVCDANSVRRSTSGPTPATVASAMGYMHPDSRRAVIHLCDGRGYRRSATGAYYCAAFLQHIKEPIRGSGPARHRAGWPFCLRDLRDEIHAAARLRPFRPSCGTHSNHTRDSRPRSLPGIAPPDPAGARTGARNAAALCHLCARRIAGCRAPSAL